MRYVLLIIATVIFGCGNTGQPYLKMSEVQLANPISHLDSMIFLNAASLDIGNIADKSDIFYRIDQGPYQLFSNSVSINNSSDIEYFAQKEGYKNSDTLYINTIKTNGKLQVRDIQVTPKPSIQYAGLGATSLTDLKTGNLSFKNNNNWLGFLEDKIEITINLKQESIVKSVMLSFLDDPNSWIFCPTDISVLSNNEIIGHENIYQSRDDNSAYRMIMEVELLNQKYSDLKIIIEPMSKIPTWHPGAGNTPWLFIDEIILN